MNLLILSDGFLPDHTGGISKSLLSEVEMLVDRGHRIVVVTRQLKRDFPTYERRNGYELYRYPSTIKGSSFYRLYPLFSLTEIPKLINQLHSKFNFDVAYIHDAFQAIGLLRCSKQIPYVYVFHAPTSREIEIDAAKGKYGVATPLVKVVNWWIRAIERQALERAHKIIVRSNFMEREIQDLYGGIGDGKTHRIPLCVDTQRFSFVENPRAIRKELNLPLDRPVLLTIRRLVARMGLENLIATMRIVKLKIPDILLLIGGTGYLESSLRSQVYELNLQSSIQFLGFIPEESLPMYYQAADLFILPTIALEGFGLSTIESLSCGTPVVATSIGANPEVLGSLGEEFLCPDITPDALSERIIWFLERDIGVDLRTSCRKYCEINFSTEKVVTAIEQLLISVARC